MIRLLKLVVVLTSIILHIIHTRAHTVDKRDAESKAIICIYYPHDKPYPLEDGRFTPEDIDPHLCTHLEYGFGNPDVSAGVKSRDKYQDIDLGGYKRFNDLKAKNPTLKTIISVGGTPEGSMTFAQFAGKREQRAEFAKNMAIFLKEHNFDGMNVRWQWPQEGDKYNQVALIKELRSTFDKFTAANNLPRFIVMVGLPDGIDDIDKGYDLPELTKYVDFIEVMTFDFIFFKQRNLAHIAPLYSSTDPARDRYTIDYVMSHVVKKGADPKKTIVGISTFGNQYTMDNYDDTAPGSPAKEHTYEKGWLPYSEICERLKSNKQWEIVKSPNKLSGPYAFRGKDWISYDDPEMIGVKAKYVIAKGLRGVAFCHLSLEDFKGSCYGKKFPLISAAKSVLFNTGEAVINPPDMKHNDKLVNGCELPIKNVLRIEYELTCSDSDPTNQCKRAKEGSLVSQYTTLSYHCQKGYVLDSAIESSSICSRKKWIPALSQCKKTCKKLNPANMNLKCEYNGKSVNCEGEMKPGTIVLPRCNPGYRTALVPDYNTITCQDDGEWSDVLFKCVAVCGHIAVSLKPLVHGGREAKVGEFPWHVGIYDKTAGNKLLCGGTIISSRIVVSAAHCFADRTTAAVRNPDNFMIGVGKFRRDYNIIDSELTKFYPVKQIFFNDYHGLQFRFENDIAVLEIATKMDFNDYVLPACVYYQTAEAPELTTGQQLSTAGWGIDENGQPSETLKVVSLPYLSTSDCLKRATSGITDFLSRDKFCAGNHSSEAVDQGDSGGGLMYQDPYTHLYYLFGIVSFKATQESAIAVFTNVQNHVNWITSLRDSIQKV